MRSPPTTYRAPQQLSQDVASYVRELIISGKLRKDEFLRIESIAKAMGVSSTPVREGLLLLQSENFVRLVPRRGFVVTGFSKQDVLDLFWVQAMLAGELAARAARRMSSGDVAQLRILQGEHEKAVIEGDLVRVEKLGHGFHRAINLAAGSERLARLLGMMVKQLPNRFYTAIEGQVKETRQYHPLILDAILIKDAEAVRALMTQHIVSGANHLISVLQDQGMWNNAAAPAEAAKIKPRAKKTKSRSSR